MKAIINTNIFLMRTRGCEVEVVNDLDSDLFVTGTILTQPNKHPKALKIGTKLKLSVLDIDYI